MASWMSLVMVIAGFVLHIWTIVIAFKLSGLFNVILTIFFPVISEIYWFFKIGINVGFSAYYCIAIMIYVVVMALSKMTNIID